MNELIVASAQGGWTGYRALVTNLLLLRELRTPSPCHFSLPPTTAPRFS